MKHPIDPSRRHLLLGMAGLTGAMLAGTESVFANPRVHRGSQQVAWSSSRPTGISWPSWRRAMAARSWCAIPATNTISAIDPARNPAYNPRLATNPNDNRGPWGAAMGIAGVLAPWCGACYDSDGDTLWLPLGGGHSDYAGNEAYAIRLADEAPTWRMPRPPSGSIPLGLINLDDGQEASGDYADGRPRAIHSVNKHIYVPGRGPFCAVQGSTFRSGQAGTRRTLLLNGVNGEWTTLATHAVNTNGQGAGCYDAARDTVWWLGAAEDRLRRFNFASNQWETLNFGSTSNVWGYHSMAYAPEHGVLINLCNELPNDFAIWDTATALRTNPGASNPRPPQLTLPGGHAGGVWVPGLNAVAMWHAVTPDTRGLITLLRAPASPRDQPWTWDTLVPVANNTTLPSVGSANGTYGRFGYAPGLDGFYLLNGVSEPVYFFALSAGEGIFANGFELS